MPDFLIELYELHSQTVRVKAKNKKEAMEKACDGEGEMVHIEYIEVADRYYGTDSNGENLPDGIRSVEKE